MMSLDDERVRCSAMLPAGAACEACGEDDPLVLNSDDRMILCAECDAIARGVEPFEGHHIGGRTISPIIVRVPLNMHRRLTARHRAWLRS
jgi:hypothetical protein